MAKAKIPDPLSRRHLLEGKLTPDQALAYADAYIEGGRRLEAVEFLAKAGADDRLEALAEEAVASGDAFLLRRVHAVRGEEPGADRWSRLAEVASAAGLDLYADTARRQAEVGEDAG